MSSPNDPRAQARPLWFRCIWDVAAVVAIVVPMTAISGLTASDERPVDRTTERATERPAERPAERPVPSAPVQATRAASVQIRCWQYGRLVFEENNVVLSQDGGPYATKLQGTDRNGQPIAIAETRNATCLIKPAVPAGRWPQ